MEATFEAVSDASPRLFYHGTSVENWSADRGRGELYVCALKETANGYAREWADEDETPIVIEIDLSKLQGHQISLKPNWETVEQYREGHWGEATKPADDLTWQDTLEMNGTFVIEGFDEACKHDVVVIRMDEPSPAEAPDL